MLSEKYGWTINEILDQPIDIIMQYIEIISAKNKIEKEARKKNNR